MCRDYEERDTVVSKWGEVGVVIDNEGCGQGHRYSSTEEKALSDEK